MMSFNELATKVFAQALDVAGRLGDQTAQVQVSSLQEKMAELPESLHWDVLDEVNAISAGLYARLASSDELQD